MDSLCYHRKTCRLCDSPQLELEVKMIPCPPVDAFVTEAQAADPQPSFPMDLYLCQACGHAQLLDVVAPSLLFGSYIYTTGSSPGLADYFKDYANSVCDQLKLGAGAFALDIGSNDGTLLSFFKQRGLRVLGVDPAREVAAIAIGRGIETQTEFFTSAVAQRIRSERGAIDLITANNVFAHSDFLGDMADGIRQLLAPSGVFVFEVSYLLDIVDSMIFDVIYHEHLSYHSVRPLRLFMKRHGLHLFRIERTLSKGGTLRCFVQLADGPRPEHSSINELLKLEEDYGLYRHETYKRFSDRINQTKQQTQAILAQPQFSGKAIAGYGASATATVLIYQFGMGDVLNAIVDDNPIRQNRYSPGLHIPVISSETLLARQPAAVVILVWRYADMIMQRNNAYREGGGQFIIPLPQPRVA
jgi:SAM-dependent methyltransferase